MNAQQKRAEKEKEEREKEAERQEQRERGEEKVEAEKTRTSSNSSSQRESSPVVNGNADATTAESANTEQEVGTVCQMVYVDYIVHKVTAVKFQTDYLPISISIMLNL